MECFVRQQDAALPVVFPASVAGNNIKAGSMVLVAIA